MRSTSKFLLFLIMITKSQEESVVLDTFPYRTRDQSDCNIEKYASTLLIKTHQGPYIHCAGVLIRPTWVLTTAKCIYKLKPNQVEIVGNFSSEENAVKIPARELVPHPDFSYGNLENDVGLIHLASAYPTWSPSNIARLPRINSSCNENPVAIGKGYFIPIKIVTNGSKAYQFFTKNDLVCMDVHMLNGSVCNEKYKLKDAKILCTLDHEGGDMSICHRYPGSPLYCNGELVGLKSYGDACGSSDIPIVYAKVDGHLDFIRNIIRFEEPFKMIFCKLFQRGNLARSDANRYHQSIILTIIMIGFTVINFFL